MEIALNIACRVSRWCCKSALVGIFDSPREMESIGRSCRDGSGGKDHSPSSSLSEEKEEEYWRDRRVGGALASSSVPVVSSSDECGTWNWCPLSGSPSMVVQGSKTCKPGLVRIRLNIMLFLG